MTNPIIFHNKGELDIRAVTTFGLSVKETDSPIGYFGTGLKYAVAVLLREGCEIEIFAGQSKYTFGASTDQFRGQDFEKITMEGPTGSMPLPFTLSLGKNWELWQAYRELYCNAKDEGGGVCDKHNQTTPIDGVTQVIVRGDVFAKVHASRNHFINDDTPIFSRNGVDVIPTPGVFLKNIRIADTIYRQPLYGYRFSSDITLTEDRTMKHAGDAERKVIEAIGACDDYELVHSILTAQDGTFEEQITWSAAKPESDVFKSVLIDLYRDHPNKISGEAKALAKTLMGARESVEDITLSPTQQTALDRATSFLAHRGVHIGDYRMRIVRTLGEGVWGQAKSGTIFLSSECFDYGVKCIVATIYEEYLHLSKGYRDFDRGMQNHLFHTIVSLWEEASGEPL